MSKRSDPSDWATHTEAQDTERALKAHLSRPRTPSKTCRDCGVVLPEIRQQFGRCLECQVTVERRERYFR